MGFRRPRLRLAERRRAFSRRERERIRITLLPLFLLDTAAR